MSFLTFTLCHRNRGDSPPIRDRRTVDAGGSVSLSAQAIVQGATTWIEGFALDGQSKKCDQSTTAYDLRLLEDIPERLPTRPASRIHELSWRLAASGAPKALVAREVKRYLRALRLIAGIRRETPDDAGNRTCGCPQ